ARAAFFTLKQQWGRLFPSAVQIIEKDLDSLLTFFQFDPTYWTVLRTNNPIEQLNREFKRRTNAMEVTGGEISTYRCLAYVAQTMEYRWSFPSAFSMVHRLHTKCRLTPAGSTNRCFSLLAYSISSRRLRRMDCSAKPLAPGEPFCMAFTR